MNNFTTKNKKLLKLKIKAKEHNEVNIMCYKIIKIYKTRNNTISLTKK